MTTIEQVGAIVGILGGLAGIIFFLDGQARAYIKRQNADLKNRVTALEKDNEELFEKQKNIERRFNDFMSDMLRYFQIK